jgi:hypothetical protein
MSGTLYFPKGTYVGAFEFIHTSGEINLVGDGQGNVLQSKGSVFGTVIIRRNNKPRWASGL